MLKSDFQSMLVGFEIWGAVAPLAPLVLPPITVMNTCSMFSAVPGVVSDLTGQPKFTSIVLIWSAPQEPNGVIISYEVTYRVSDGYLVTTNTTDFRFTIPSLTPGTNVTEISVSAYTIVGRGDPVHIPLLVTLTSLRE